MQKNYRDFTVGELLDMGFQIVVNNHNDPTKEEAFAILERLEGLKRTTYKVNENKNDEFEIAKGWDEDFKILNFLEKNSSRANVN